MGCTSSKQASRLESGAASSAAVFLSVQEDARVAANPVAQANQGTTTSVQNRLTLGEEFANCASYGNPNMSRKNAVVISAADLKAWGRMRKYEECVEQHVPIEDLAASDKVLFISHRWQDALKNLADDAAGSQYRVIMAFLLGSEEGQSVAFVWLDLACINQDRGTPDRPNPEGLKQFLLKLDNIGTAIACSHTVLVVPRLEQQQVDGQSLYYSDLEEYTKRGWCLLEILSAIEMRCHIRVALVCGAPAEARFELVQPGPAPGEKLTLAKLVEEGNRARGRARTQRHAPASNSLRAAVGRALEALRSPGAAPAAAAAGALLDQAAECWNGAEDPAALLRTMHEALDADLRLIKEYQSYKQQREAATLTVDPNPQYDSYPQAGKAIAELLPRFTAEADREVVVRLLANLLVLGRTAFAAVVPRIPEVHRAHVLEGLDLDHANGPTLDLSGDALLPCEVGLVVEALVAELARREAAGEGLAGRPLRLDLSGNPIGPHGVKALREAAPRLPPLRYLNLAACGLGAGGALELAELLATPCQDGATVGAHLEGLGLGRCGLGEAGGRAVAAALPSVPELKNLALDNNGLGEAGGRAVAAALPSVPELKDLGLLSNGLGEAGGRALAEALPSVPELKLLGLSGNGLGEAAGRALAEALPSVPELMELHLEMNDMGEAGGRAVAEALPSVPELKGLFLQGNDLGEAAKAVRAAWAAPLPDGGARPYRLYM